MNEYPEHDEIVTGQNPQSLPRSNRRAGVIGLVAIGGLAAGGAALYVANSAGAAPSSSTSTSASAPSGSSSSGSSSSSSSATCTMPGPAAGGRGGGGRPAGGPGAGGPGGGPAGAGADGRITAVSSTSLTVRDLFAKSHTYKVTSATVVHSGPARSVKVSALSVGEHVVVRTTSSTSTAADIDLHLAHIDGSVTAVTSSAITVSDRDGFTRTIDTDGQTKYTLNSASSSRSKVTTGTVVHAEGKVDADGTALDATTIDVATSAKAPAAGGVRPCAPAAGHGPGAPGHHAGPPAAPKPTASGGSSTPAKPTPSATTTR